MFHIKKNGVLMDAYTAGAKPFTSQNPSRFVPSQDTKHTHCILDYQPHFGIDSPTLLYNSTSSDEPCWDSTLPYGSPALEEGHRHVCLHLHQIVGSQPTSNTRVFPVEGTMQSTRSCLDIELCYACTQSFMPV